ncbi:response regulator [Geodermatophilus sp. DSM 45219]|uniref:response regulator n=1 Tax=Geodermatophilus sp. DSM 45219 TaxID=1881103 RepID=UPI0008900E0A|nr:response regulator [Geodermatophilus sp. DSM 45219]SDN98379.1 Histidine kinase-, DNA gyrase B-, and HSP90-like ATPase [Geodermatophilus sp. DSM 45219]
MTPPGTSAGRSLERALSQAVRTPLHSLLGFLELLTMGDLDADQRRLGDQLMGSAEDLLAGSDRVLWLLRLLGGHYAPRPARVYLAAFAAEVAAESGGTVSDVVAPDTPAFVDADLAALHQLVTELIGNAVAHGRAPVVLAVTPDGPRRDAVRITVSDGGPGLPPAAREALTGPESDDGLGLLLVRRLAGLLGGTVQVLPAAAGAQVALVLPVAAPGDRPVATPTPAAGPGGAAPPLRVLLVEDNATNRLLTQRQLARLGHSLVAVATGEAGVEAALAEDGDGPVDVVLMDRHLPDIDGCEATRRIRAALPAHRGHLPVIAVTADVTADARDACAAAGMDEVLTKPVDLRRLSAALERAAAVVDRFPDGRVAEPTAGDRGYVPAALHAVLARVDGDAEAAAELVATYLGELPGRRLRIQASLRRDEPRGVFAAAESLRTSSDSLGVSAVAGACAALAAAAEAGDLAAARAFLPRLVRQCQEATADLTGYAEPARIAEVLGSPAG